MRSYVVLIVVDYPKFPCCKYAQTHVMLPASYSRSANQFTSVLHKVVAVRNVHLTGVVKIVPLLMCAMSASVSFTP
jgi:hypothetical protein